MGSYLDICCENSTPQHVPIRYIETAASDAIAEAEIQKEQAMILNTQSRLPTTVMQMKIKTKNLIQKRNENPFDHYIIEKNLGSGSYGVVYKVTHRVSKQVRALKQIPKANMTDGVSRNQIANEIQINRLLDHPNIMKIYEFYEDNDNFYILSEFCEQGDLKSKCEKHGVFSEFSVKFFMYQVFNAIAYLHEHKVIHGDIKLENILLYSNLRQSQNILRQFSALDMESKMRSVINDLKNMDDDDDINNTYPKKSLTSRTEQYLKDLSNYEIKLIDFGCSKIFNRKKLKGLIGTTVYCSPEVIDNNFTEKCDEWSCGVLMYFLLAGEPPFLADSEEELFYHIKHSPLEFPKKLFADISEECKSLIRKLLIKDADKRISATDALKEPFFANNLSYMIDNQDDILYEKEIRDKLNELKNYHKSKSKFQEMVLAYIALNYIDKDEEIKIKKIFRAIDKKHNYQITRKEFRKFCEEFFDGGDITKEEVDELFDVIDSDKNGSLEYQELIRAMCDKTKLLTIQNLKLAFDFFDVDKSGKISCDEINKIIFHDREVDDSLMNEYLGEIGKKKDDLITFEEFCDIVK